CSLAQGTLAGLEGSRVKLLTVLLVLLGIAGVGTGIVVAQRGGGATPPATGPVPESIEALVGKLRSETPSVRDQAEQSLQALPPARVPELRKALECEKDLEARTRLTRVIEHLELSALR